MVNQAWIRCGSLERVQRGSILDNKWHLLSRSFDFDDFRLVLWSTNNGDLHVQVKWFRSKCWRDSYKSRTQAGVFIGVVQTHKNNGLSL
jgi:hypothetical protein